MTAMLQRMVPPYSTRRRRSPAALRLVALLALIGLLAPSLARVAGPEAAGWFVGHGHVYLDPHAAVSGHTHPWDHPAPSDAPATDDHDAAAHGGTPGVLFTLGDLDALGGAAALAVPPALALAIAWLTLAMHEATSTRPSLRLVPLVPPPQG